MKKTIPIIIFASTLIVWIISLTFIKDPDLIMYLAGALLGELAWLCSLFVFPRYDGELVITGKEDGKTLYTLNLHSDPEEWASMSEILLKVQPEEEQ